MAVAALTIFVRGITASGAINQYAAVTHAGAMAGAAGNSAGFAETGGAIGDRVPTATLGTAIAVASAAIALGAAVEVAGAGGQVVTKSAGITIGRALTAAAASGDLIEVLIIPN